MAEEPEPIDEFGRVLTQGRKNEVVEHLGTLGLSRDEITRFQWKTRKLNFAYRVSALVHPAGERYFIFDTREEGKLRAIYCPTESSAQKTENMPTWKDFLKPVGEWAIRVTRDAEQPDLLAQLREQADVLGEAETVDETPFTADERARLATAIGDLKNWLVERRLVEPEQMEAVNRKLDQLVADANTQTRRRWKDMFLGVLLTIGVQNALESQAFKNLLQFAWESVGPIIMHLPQLPS